MNSSGSGSGGLGRNTIGRKETMRMTDYNKHKLSHPDIACSLTSRPHRVTSLFHCDQELIEDISGYSRGWLEVRETGKEAATKIFREWGVWWLRHRLGEAGAVYFVLILKTFSDTGRRKIYRLKVLRLNYVLNGQNIDFCRDESSRTESSNQLDQERFHPLRYRTQFNL